MTTKTTFSFSISMNGKSNNYRIEPVWDGKQTSITEYRVVNEFGHTVFVGDAEACNTFVYRYSQFEPKGCEDFIEKEVESKKKKK